MSEGIPAKVYSRPPVVEAIIELQYDPQLSDRESETLRSKLSKRYPALVENRLFEVQIDEKGNATTKSNSAGFKGTSADNTNVVISNPGAFASVRLAPYCGWDEVIAVAKENYDTFRAVAGHRAVKRIGVRYVNRIDLPEEEATKLPTNAIFNVYAAAPSAVPQIPRHFFARYEYGFAEDNIIVVIQTGTADPALIDQKSFMLDIDVIKTENISQKPEDLWSVIDVMRRAKNDAFELSVTELTKRTFSK